jgi:hypothetical protein
MIAESIAMIAAGTPTMSAAISLSMSTILRLRMMG